MTICATEYAAIENCRGAAALTSKPGPKWKGVAGILSLERNPELDFAASGPGIEFLPVTLEEIGLIAALDARVRASRHHPLRQPFLLDRVHGVANARHVALVKEHRVSLRRDG